MVFSSVLFLGLFLPCFICVYFVVVALCKTKWAPNLVLLLFSLFFYAWGEPIWVVLLIFSGSIDYIHGVVIHHYFGKWQAKAALISSLVLNLGILFLFKYSGFLVENVNWLFAPFGITFHVPNFRLPIGISFYTFQTLSYTIDMYRGQVRYQKSFVAFLAYVTMFPQLVAGPIVRYCDIAPSLTERNVTLSQFSEGVMRFCVGLGKKVLLANSAGKVATLLLSDIHKSSSLGAWVGILFFTFQIYFDFSGYSDMAIGMGKMFGFTFKENFNYPFVAKSMGEYWRKWHISLTTFFMDYVYIPLGGNRKHYVRNVFVVWFLSGLWHGAHWNFILWGLYYALWLYLEKLFLGQWLKKVPSFFAHCYTWFVTLLAFGIFYFVDINAMLRFLKAFFFVGVAKTDFVAISVLLNNVWLLLVLAVASTPWPKQFFAKMVKQWKACAFLEPVFACILMIVSFLMLLGDTYNPFLYFRF